MTTIWRGGSMLLAVRVNACRPRAFDNQTDVDCRAMELLGSNAMRMTRIEKRFVNEIGHSGRVAEEAVRRLRHVSVQRSWSYLDVGCGNGAAGLLVADTFGVRVVGVDVDPQQIALASAAARDRTDVFFMTADATGLPFEDGRFDIVATSKTTHHVPKWSPALAEMRRVLKPRGYLVYADLKAPSWLARVLKPLAGHVGVFTGADLDRCFASLQPVHRHTGWLHYEAILQKP
jgi:ubiquinone/menaquinone biosynthesis C-methylase UbiE